MPVGGQGPIPTLPGPLRLRTAAIGAAIAGRSWSLGRGAEASRGNYRDIFYGYAGRYCREKNDLECMSALGFFLTNSPLTFTALLVNFGSRAGSQYFGKSESCIRHSLERDVINKVLDARHGHLRSSGYRLTSRRYVS